MKKRLASLLICGALAASTVAGIAGCGTKGDVINLTVWGPETQQAILARMVNEFKAANPDKNYSIKIGIGEEDMAYSNVSKDATAAADVFCYASDQLVNLLTIGALARIGGTNLDALKAMNTEDSVKAATLDYGTDDEKVYGYPYASDNGYFLYYDKSVVSDEAAQTLEGIIAACEAKNKEISWALDVAYYTAGFFFTYGCTYDVEYDYNNNYADTITLTGFNEEAGIKACKAMVKLADSKACSGLNTDNNTIISKFGDGIVGAAVSGTWVAKDLQQILGDNYGVCKLPTVNVDGEDKQLYSFRGYKYFGVNAYSANRVEAHKLALFLSGEDMQKQRFDELLVGPTNKVVSELPEVKADVTLQALNAQNQFAVEQLSVPAKFWSPLETVGSYILQHMLNEDGTNGRDAFKPALDQMVKLMNP